jgi:hypothetical protein
MPRSRIQDDADRTPLDSRSDAVIIITETAAGLDLQFYGRGNASAAAHAMVESARGHLRLAPAREGIAMRTKDDVIAEIEALGRWIDSDRDSHLIHGQMMLLLRRAFQAGFRQGLLHARGETNGQAEDQ